MRMERENRFCAFKWFSGSRYDYDHHHRRLISYIIILCVSRLSTRARSWVIHFSSSSGWHLICIFMAELHYEGEGRTCTRACASKKHETWARRYRSARINFYVTKAKLGVGEWNANTPRQTGDYYAKSTLEIVMGYGYLYTQMGQTKIENLLFA